MMKRFTVILLLSLLISCASDTVVEEAIVDDVDGVSSLTIGRVENVKEVFLTIPSPIETADLFYVAGTEYVPEETNPTENVNIYTTNGKKALNLGVYGADLSFVNVFDQSEQTMIYIDCTKKMSDALDLTSAFGIETIERIEDNLNNRDSLMVIVGDAFWIIDTHLKDNGLDYLSALIMTGGWIEGLYLGTKVLDKKHPNEVLMKRIAAQKTSLLSLMALLGTYDNAQVLTVSIEMKELLAVYERVDENVVDSVIIFEIGDAVSEVRTQIIR